MDFGERIGKRVGPDETGHYPWESRALRARLEEERKAAKPRVVQGIVSGKDWNDVYMINRDEPKKAGMQ